MNAGDQNDRVLSIQSTVVCGYVGNKSATFPLQLHGFDVCAINSVQFSNHTGYGVFPGQRLDDKDVCDLFEGMRVNDLLHFSHVLTGYIGKVSFLEKVGENIAEMKKANPDLKFVCDPVMGDNGKFYVAKELLPVYRDQILPLATILTPNQFELEQLSGLTISSEDEAFVAIDALHHDKGVPTVVLSSSSLGTPDTLQCLASTLCNGKKKRYRLQIPLLKATFVGTGDLFAACLLTWMHKDDNLKEALEKTVATVQAVIKKTLDYAQRAAGEGNKPSWKQMELRLVQCKRIIEDPQPEVTIKAQDISS